MGSRAKVLASARQQRATVRLRPRAILLFFYATVTRHAKPKAGIEFHEA